MKTLAATLAVVLLLTVAVYAQHTDTLTWTLSTSSGITAQTVYRAPCTGPVTNNACTEGTFAKIAAVTATTTSYVDTTVVGGSSYSYYVTATCSACSPQESVPSNHYAVTVPGNQPNPPTGLTITNVAQFQFGGYTFALAQWTDSLDQTQSYTFKDASGTILTQGERSTPWERDAAVWIGKTPKLPITFTVCDGAGCVSKTAS